MGVPIPPIAQAIIDEIEGGTRNKIKIKEVSPSEDEHPVLGTVISINDKVNFLKRLKYSDNSVGRGLLGRLVRNSYAEIIIREEPNNNECNQFTVYIDLNQFNNLGIRLSSKVFVVLSTYRLPGNHLFWIVDKCELS
jgi:hypothetical protein